MIEIGERFGEHPRTPGPRLMRREGMGMARELERRAVLTLTLEAGLGAQAEAHREAMKRAWDEEWSALARGRRPAGPVEAMAAD